jgi:class 3 adenylate cyclase
MGQTFIEEPYYWEYGKWYANLRREGKGPLKTLAQYVTFTREKNGYRMNLRFGFDAHRSFKGMVFKVMSIFMKAQNKKVFNEIDFSNENPVPLHQSFQANEKRLKQLGELLKKDHDVELVEQLLSHIKTAIDTDLKDMAPYYLAEQWGRYPEKIARYREEILEILLDSTRHGYMRMQWSPICPSCRGTKEQVSRLSDLKLEAHCESCNISFGVRFSESVQVSFRPTPAVRKLQEGLICVAGPRRTPHQFISHVIAPGERIPLDEKLVFDRPNRLILRSFDGDMSRDLHEKGLYRINENGIQAEESNDFIIENNLPRATKVVVQEERLPGWVLTAAELIRRQSFIDHFSSEVLHPELQAEVGTITLMFSDLVGSTKLYRERGDADAFAVVNDHFRLLKGVLNDHQGTLIKTVGDAIMAVFEEPEKAVACGVAMQRKMSEESDLGLRLGLHVGPCLAVTLNNRLDYFGGTVNQAARMEGQSRPGEMVLSDSLFQDGEVREWLETNEIEVEEDQVLVKGIEKSLPIFRIKCL